MAKQGEVRQGKVGEVKAKSGTVKAKSGLKCVCDRMNKLRVKISACTEANGDSLFW